MLEKIKNTLFYNWNLMRIMRVGIGLIVLYQSIDVKDWMIGAFAAILLSQGLFNWGCCGAQGCVPNKSDVKNNTIEDVIYEEVK